MQFEIILSIVGSFGTLALLVNGYFLRGIFQDLNLMKVEFARINTVSDGRKEKIQGLEKDTILLWASINEMKEKFHSLGNHLNMVELNKSNIDEMRNDIRSILSNQNQGK